MLKWLVTRGPTTNQAPQRVVTDDPLATLRVKTKSNTHQIYAVSRVNPLYHDEEVEITTGMGEEEEEEEEEEDVRIVNEVNGNKEVNLPESPPTDRGSVRSSGYGSKETDSVSEGSSGHDEDDILGAEVEAVLKPPPAPSPFRDNRKQPDGKAVQVVGIPKSPSSNDGNNNGSSHSVAQICKSFEDITQNTSPIVVSSKGKPVATIVSQHPQFVKSIDVGIRRAKSLETFQQQRVIQNSGSSTIPRPVWPKVSSLVESLQQETNRRQHLLKLRESMSVEDDIGGHKRVPSPADIVKHDSRYVTAIHVSPKHLIARAKSFASGRPKENFNSANNLLNRSRANTLSRGIGLSHDDISEPKISRYFGEERQNSSFNLISLQPDSLVTEDTLRMMRYGGRDEVRDEGNEAPIQVVENEIHAPLPDFSQVMYTRGLYATLNRAASLSTRDIVKPPYKTRSHSIDFSIPSKKINTRKKGLSSMKGLWEKSGLKTNGRKLIVDVNDLLDSSSDELDQDEDDGAQKLRNTKTSSNSYPSLIYEEPINYNHIPTSQPVSETMESRFSDTYAEINDFAGDGIDNPAFLDDKGQQHYFGPGVSSPYNKKPRFLDPDKMAEFQKRISEKLQGAPHHRTQWLDLDEIVIEGVEDKQERRVKFTSDTINPGSLDRRDGRGGAGHRKNRAPAVPGGAVRTLNEKDVNSFSRRQHQEVTLEPSSLMDSIRSQRNHWSSSENYRDSYQDAPQGSLTRGNHKKLWDTTYGTTSTFDRTYPRRLAPHPNGHAPVCEKVSSACHDFTLDLRRSHKLTARSTARKKRRRCYIIIVVLIAFIVFLGMVVVISWYSTGGEKFFGPL